MTSEIPQYALRAYSLFFLRFGTRSSFRQSVLDWIVSQSMKKKIFAVLLKNGWLRKKDKYSYNCIPPEGIFRNLLDFKVPEIIKKARKPYSFTRMSAIEIWSDFCYIQRGIDKSPYYVKVLKKDIPFWKRFFNKNQIPNYINQGTTIGEYVILIPATKLKYEEKEGLKVEPLGETLKQAKSNEMYAYAYKYIKEKYNE